MIRRQNPDPGRWLARRATPFLPVLLLYVLAPAVSAAEPEALADLEFSDGEKIVLLGGTLIEQAQKFGYLETAILSAHKGKEVTVRNLGWSADDVYGTSRGRFGFQPEGFRHLVHHVKELKPTLLVLNYGANEAFQGAKGVDVFRKGFLALLDAVSETGAKILILAPHKQEALGGKLPDPSAYNDDLVAYVNVLKEIAAERGLYFFDLSTALPVKDAEGSDSPPLTYNSRHLTDMGHRKLAEVFSAAAGFPVPEWGALEKARELVIAKNRLYFHRWRPQNETYLTLFRKHEQGQNYREIPQFDPLIKATEQEIRDALASSDDTP